MRRRFYIAGFSFGLIGIILGAFATHGLKPVLSLQAMDSFQTGVDYQIYHAFLFLIVANFSGVKSRLLSWVFYLLIAGILLFSGSIFLLATNSLTPTNFQVLGPVTPVGGSLLILCWILLLGFFIKLKNE